VDWRDSLTSGRVQKTDCSEAPSLRPLTLQPDPRAPGDPLAPKAPHFPGKAKRVIFMYMSGGVSHLDTFDLKPDAPAEFRGEFKPAPTCVPGIQVVDLLPRVARQMDKCLVVRSMTHRDFNPPSAVYWTLTGREYPPSTRYLNQPRPRASWSSLP